MDADPTKGQALTASDALAMEYCDFLKSHNIEQPANETNIVAGFAMWLFRNYDIYRLDEVNRG